MKPMGKVWPFLGLLAAMLSWSTAMRVAAQNNKPAQAAQQNGDKLDDAKENDKVEEPKFTLRLTVSERENTGISADDFKAMLKESFEASGHTIVDEASNTSIDMNFVLGKDDGDDDNDGIPDATDPTPYGGTEQKDQIKVVDMDTEMPAVNYKDVDKKVGVYIYRTDELGNAEVFTTKADMLKAGKAEENANAQFIVPQKAGFQKTSFSPLANHLSLSPKGNRLAASPPGPAACNGSCINKQNSCNASVEDKKLKCVIECGVPLLPGYDKCRQQCDDYIRAGQLQCLAEAKICEVRCKTGQ